MIFGNFWNEGGYVYLKQFFVLGSKYINFENDDQNLLEINSDFTKTTTSLFGANEEKEERYAKSVITHIILINLLHVLNVLLYYIELWV